MYSQSVFTDASLFVGRAVGILGQRDRASQRWRKEARRHGGKETRKWGSKEPPSREALRRAEGKEKGIPATATCGAHHSEDPGAPHAGGLQIKLEYAWRVVWFVAGPWPS
jgi:hypothetical protein